MLIKSVKKSINDLIESAINVENEKTSPIISYSVATIAFMIAVNNITFFSFICILLKVLLSKQIISYISFSYFPNKKKCKKSYTVSRQCLQGEI